MIDSNQTSLLNQNEANFKTVGKISEAEKINIIKTWFRLKDDGGISFQKYYEGTGNDTLFQLRGYQIKY